MQKKRRVSTDLRYYILMIAPTIIIYLLLMVVLAKTIRLSFFQWNGLGEETFVGIDNFIRLFQDSRFLFSLRNIFIFIIATIVIQVGSGVILAYLLTEIKVRWNSFFKSVIFLPVVISNVAVSLYFVKFFDYENGLLNYLLVSVGLDKVNLLGSGPNTIYYAILPQTWQYIGLMFIIAYTGFSTVPKSYIEASIIDGLNSFQRLIHMYIPISWSSLSSCFIIALVGPLKAFEHLWILTERGGADQLSHVPATLMYYLGFSNYEYGYGSAIAVLICILALLLVILFKWLTDNKFKQEGDA